MNRDFTITREAIDKKARTVELAISSETPYERWWGIEVLDHSPASVDLSRLNDGRHPLLLGHGDTRDQVGVVHSVWLNTDKILRGLARFGKSALASEILDDVVDEIRTLVSVGYTIDEMAESKRDENGETVTRILTFAEFDAEMRVKHGDGWYRDVSQRATVNDPPTYRVTKWTPFEVSIVHIPADPAVGVGRAFTTPAAMSAQPQELKMSEHDNAAAGAGAEMSRSVSVEAGFDASAAEEARKNAIRHICKQADIDEPTTVKWLLEGVSVQDAQKRGMDVLAARHADFKRSAATVGLSSRELQQYSLFRMIEAVGNHNPTKAGLEYEVHQALQNKLNRLPNERSFFLPSDKACHLQPVDLSESRERGRTFMVPAEILSRDLTAASGSGGGYLVETANQSFIEMLRNRSVALRMGATRLTGLQGNITVPKQTAAGTAYWLTNEATGITESQQTLAQLSLSPKNVGAYTELSRQLLLQSNPSAEAMVMNDLATVVGLAVDAAILEGAGSGGAPTGISATSGIGSVTGGSLAAAGVIEFMTDIAAANVVPQRPGYVTTAAVAGLLMVRPELPSTGTTRLWTGNPWDGALFGVPAMTTAQVTAATMVFGAWEQAILAEWGVLEIEVNPYANFAAGIRGIRAMYSVDVGIRWAAAFSRATSVT